ncbi:large conductance mechanosensitive channel protein MscL [Gordonia hankookensis]|uniref:Large-conductance mechanosensitive channel n=2 Tax=Gordonia hankookensis TaxID=589403 RepID=A0ABR7WEQ1_9ACTN|nr:large conductance mechanosensitive channel protein MscL [Gordonia hankookensis]MBD1321265.1 large conductance mechanosensitive channel protein MscL [Gordonia hankookensis]
MLKGFKEFILKGNVVELATAVIIGAAFTAIVTAFTDSIIQPLLNSIPGGSNPAKGLGFQITDNPSTFVDIGALVTALINFLIIAAVVYFLIVVPYNKLAALGGYSKKAEVTEVALLAEIRDLLDPDGTSKAQDVAEAELPDHIQDHGALPGSDAGATQRLSTPPPAEPMPPTQPAPTPPPPGGNPPYPTPQPAPGSYPPPGAYPPGNYPQQGGYPGQTQFPGDYPPPDAPGRHSR